MGREAGRIRKAWSEYMVGKTISPIKNKKNCYNPTERKEGYEQSVLISTSQMINYMKICSASLLTGKIC